jgi:hypothetical protein
MLSSRTSRRPPQVTLAEQGGGIMVKRILLLMSALLISQALCQEVLADIRNFSIVGTYGQGLMNKDGTVTLFSAGDTFSIQGSFDTTAQPHMATKSNPDLVLTDPPFFYDFASIISLTNSIPFTLINAYYPSDEGSMNDGDYKNGAYFTNTILPTVQSFYQADSYTELSVTNLMGNLSGLINYDFHTVTEPQGGGNTLVIRVYNTIDLNITEFKTSAVPLPTSLLFLVSGLAGLPWLKRKMRNGSLKAGCQICNRRR